MEEKLEDVEEKLESAGVESEDSEKTLGAEKVSAGEEKKEACAERKSESTEEVLAHEGEMTAAKTSSEDVGKKQDKKDKKNKISRKKAAGGVELAAAFILAVLSGWLFFNTRGTRLLYVSVTTGRVSRYYWIFLAAVVIFLAIGVFTLKFRGREEKENLLERDKKPVNKIQSEENTDE